MKLSKMDNFFKWLAKYIVLHVGLNFFSKSQWGYYIFLIILNESIVKCLTRFGRSVKILKDKWKSYKLERLCVGFKFYFIKPMWLLHLVV